MDREPGELLVATPAIVRVRARVAELATGGPGGVVLLTGESGSGKSAVLTAVGETVDPERVQMARAAGVPGDGSAVPYAPFAAAIRQLLDEQASRRRAARSTFTDAVMEFGPDLLGMLVPFGFLAGRVLITRPWRLLLGQGEESDDDVAMVPAGGDLRPAAEVVEQYARVLRRVSESRAVVLLLDDLPWFDEPSLHLVERLTVLAREAAVLLVGTLRPSALPADHRLRALLVRPDVEVVPVLPDDPIGARSVVDALVDSAPNTLDEDARQVLAARAGGHPLLTIEALRDLQARGVVVRDPDGRWTARGELTWSGPPPALAQIIRARVADLPRDVRDLLEVAAVAGSTFTAEVVAAAVDRPPRAVVRALGTEAGRDRELVDCVGVEPRPDGDGRRSTYRFRSELLAQRLRDLLDPAERAYLHEAVAAGLLAVDGDTADPVEVAGHLEAALSPHAAAPFHLAAAEAALRRHAPDVAEAWVARAGGRLDDPSLQVRAALVAARVARLGGDHAVMTAALAQLRAARRAVASRVGGERVSGGSVPDVGADEQAALEELRLVAEVEDLAAVRASVAALVREEGAGRRPSDADVAATEALLVLTTVLLRAELLDEAAATADRACAVLGVLPPGDPLRHALAGKGGDGVRQRLGARAEVLVGAVAHWRGDLATAAAWLEQAVATATAVGDQRTLATALVDLGALRASQRDTEGATHALEAAAASYDRVGDRLGEVEVLSNLSQVHLLAGRPDRALDAADRGRRRASELGDPYWRCVALVNAGEARRRCGAHAAARDLTRAAERIAVDQGMPTAAAVAAENLGLIALGRGDVPAATRAARRAVALAADLHGADQLAVARVLLARTLLAAGEPGEVVPLLEQAIAAWDELGDAAQADVARVWLAVAVVRHPPDRETAPDPQQLLAGFLAGRRDRARRESEPLVTSLVAIEVLERLGDRRHRALLAQAVGEMERRADLLDDPWRSSFLAKVPEHVALRELADRAATSVA